MRQLRLELIPILSRGKKFSDTPSKDAHSAKNARTLQKNGGVELL